MYEYSVSRTGRQQVWVFVSNGLVEVLKQDVSVETDVVNKQEITRRHDHWSLKGNGGWKEEAENPQRLQDAWLAKLLLDYSICEVENTRKQ